VDDARDTPGVIAPPPLIALATLILGLALDWFLVNMAVPPANHLIINLTFAPSSLGLRQTTRL